MTSYDVPAELHCDVQVGDHRVTLHIPEGVWTPDGDDEQAVADLLAAGGHITPSPPTAAPRRREEKI